MIQKIEHDRSTGRVETGVVQFGEDWPGYFIRGDDCMRLRMEMEWLNEKIRDGIGSISEASDNQVIANRIVTRLMSQLWLTYQQAEDIL